MATITVWLFLESETLTADQMSERIGIPFDRSWRKGEARGRTGKVFSTNSWKLESQSDVDENPIKVGEKVEVCLDDVLGRIGDYTDRFRALTSDQKSGLYIGISANEAPALGLKAETISKIGALGVDLEIDLML
ncbi:MAG TPA: DUF4279 domain-containing protein [Candidatus Acidoferrales bacterium]|nr:DUF4279 domain-containing protein [Candidatus Acidoferrales bacterium]